MNSNPSNAGALISSGTPKIVLVIFRPPVVPPGIRQPHPPAQMQAAAALPSPMVSTVGPVRQSHTGLSATCLDAVLKHGRNFASIIRRCSCRILAVQTRLQSAVAASTQEALALTLACISNFSECSIAGLTWAVSAQGR